MRMGMNWIAIGGLMLWAVACGSEDDPALEDGYGGTPGSGAGSSAGGLVASGGGGGAQIGNGGVTGNGGVMGTGGFTPGAGGVIGAGGGPGAGGSGSGGDPGSGGSGAGGDGTGGSSTGGAGTGGSGTGGSGGGSTTIPKHGDPPSAPTSARGPYTTQTFQIAGAGCVHYPTNAEGPFAAVVISDGAGGSGGCNSIQTGQWGPFYASWGIVTMIITTTGSDQPEVRGRKLTAAIAAFKTENGKSGSPLAGKLAGRYGSSGFSMGGGGTTYTAEDDPTLLTNIPIMPWRPVRGTNIKVPSLYICGQTDNIASCNTHGTPSFEALPDSTPQMRITVSAGHSGQPTAGSGASGKAGLAFQKVFLEGDERWRPLLKMIQNNSTNIQ